jgi:NADH-quinone oxidoreductase subunit C
LSSEAEAPEAADDVVTDDAREALLARITEGLGDAVLGSYILPGKDLWVRVATDSWIDTVSFAVDSLGMTYFNWLSAVDWMPSPFGREMDSEVDTIVHGAETKDPEPMEQGYTGGDTRFQVLARLNNVPDNFSFTFKVDVPDDSMTIDSITSVCRGANWHEREAAEMYGIVFTGHPDPRKIYLPNDFEGNPLRKDYPLLARRVKPWPGIVDVEVMPGEDSDDDEGGDDE